MVFAGYSGSLHQLQMAWLDENQKFKLEFNSFQPACPINEYMFKTSPSLFKMVYTILIFKIIFSPVYGAVP